MTECLALVTRVFDLYGAFVGELFDYARNHSIADLRAGHLGPGRHDRAPA